MKRVQFFSPTRHRYISCLTDQLIYTKSKSLFSISLIGRQKDVQELQGAINSGYTIQVYEPDGEFNRTGYQKAPRVYASGKYTTIKTDVEDIAHYIMHLTAEGSESSRIPLFSWKQNGKELVLDYLETNYSLPVLPEWKDWLFNQLQRRGHVEELIVDSFTDVTPPVALSFYFKTDIMDKIIQEGLKTNQISMPFEYKAEEPVFHVENLSGYLKDYGTELAERITERFSPRHDPRDGELSNKLFHLKRAPFRAQADVIEGSVKTLDSEPATLIVGEMGTGKTLIGAAIPYVHSKDKKYRALVMAPNHLLQKWKREILNTIPLSEVTILRNYKDVLKLREEPKETKTNHYYIIGRDMAKLDYLERPAVKWVNKIGKDSNGRRHNWRTFGWQCPECGGFQDGSNIQNSGGRRRRNYEFDEKSFNKKGETNTYCTEEVRVWNRKKKIYEKEKCGAYLWTADNTRVRKHSPASLIKEYLTGHFDYFIADEIHELKRESQQGVVLGQLAAACDKVIGLTGTLLGGYAQDLFYLLYRIDPSTMKKEGFSYNSIEAWNERYGIKEKTIDLEFHSYSRSTPSRRRTRTTHIRPGVSPVVFGKHLLNITSFIQLSDLQQDLPSYTEHVEIIPMSPSLLEGYSDMAGSLVRRYGRQMNGIRKYIQSLMVYPDSPYNWEPFKDDEGTIILQPKNLEIDTIYPKERRLIELVQSEKDQDRKCMVFAQWTGKYKALERLKTVLEGAGFKVAVMGNNVGTEKREAWIEKKSKEVDAILCNTTKVETGLDLIQFPTIIHYQAGYKLTTLRQSSRRSWRIGQNQPVRVYFMAYENTAQDSALRLLGDKMEASMAIEGRFSEEGLQSLSEGMDMVNELAKSLISGITVESAESIWKRMGERQSDYQNSQVEDTEYLARFGQPEHEEIELESTIETVMDASTPMIEVNGVYVEEKAAAYVPPASSIPNVKSISLLEFSKMHKDEIAAKRKSKKKSVETTSLFDLIS